jgi:hypothetical protein
MSVPLDQHELLERIRTLEQRLTAAETALSELGGPYPRLAIVRHNADTGGWQEYTVVNGSIVPFDGGRASSGDDGAEMIAMDGYQVVLEVVDHDRHRYVPVGGIVDLRYNTDTDKAQVSFVTDPAADDWVDKINFFDCGAP